MRIIVLGKSYSSKKTADKLAENKENIVFSNADCTLANKIDFNLDTIDEIKDFINANEIDFLFTVDNEYLDYDFSFLTEETECVVLCPNAEGARLCTSRSAGKKFAYKNKIQTTKFAVFEKSISALEYVQTSDMPVVIMPDRYYDLEVPFIAETKSKAQERVEFLFQTGNKKIVLENYTSGVEFTKYALMDGIEAVDLFETVSYFDRVSTNNTNYIKKEAYNKIQKEIAPALRDAFMEEGVDYKGVIGISFMVDRIGNVHFSGFKPFFKALDIDIALSTLDFNLEKVLFACAVGHLNGVEEEIKISQDYAAAIDSNNEIITATAKTMNRAYELAINDGADEKEIKEAISVWTN